MSSDSEIEVETPPNLLPQDATAAQRERSRRSRVAMTARHHAAVSMPLKDARPHLHAAIEVCKHELAHIKAEATSSSDSAAPEEERLYWAAHFRVTMANAFFKLRDWRAAAHHAAIARDLMEEFDRGWELEPVHAELLELAVDAAEQTFETLWRAAVSDEPLVPDLMSEDGLCGPKLASDAGMPSPTEVASEHEKEEESVGGDWETVSDSTTASEQSPARPRDFTPGPRSAGPSSIASPFAATTTSMNTDTPPSSPMPFTPSGSQATTIIKDVSEAIPQPWFGPKSLLSSVPETASLPLLEKTPHRTTDLFLEAASAFPDSPVSLRANTTHRDLRGKKKKRSEAKTRAKKRNKKRVKQRRRRYRLRRLSHRRSARIEPTHG